MPRIAIVDDQEEYLEEICNLIEKFYFKNGIPYVVNTFSNAQLLLYEMEEKLYFDIYLLDIEMPGINGLSLAEKIRSMDDAGYIVFITSHLKFLINGYDYFAYQFIPKNNLKKKLISTLESLQKRLDIEEEKFYQICTNHRYEKILYKDIYYVYKDEKYAIFVTQNGNIPIRETLKNICNGVQREHNKKLNNGLPILRKVPPKRDYGRYFCIMAEKGGTSHGGLTEKLSPFFHAKKQEVNAYGR